MNKQQGVAYEEKIPVFYEFVNEKIHCYDSEVYGYISKQELKEVKSLTGPSMMIKKSERDKKKVNGKLESKTLKELYEEFVKDADELKKLTDGVINMYKTGSNAKTAIELAYYYLNKANIVAETIGEREGKWLEDASHGPIVFGVPYEGEAYKYDLNSSYPSIYSSLYFLVPIKSGEFKRMSKEEFDNLSFYQYGIFRAVVTYPDDKKDYRKIFKLNENNKYTHYDLTYAKKIGCKIDIIDDGNDNYLYYSRDKCKTGHECFKKFVDLLYPLRQNAIVSRRCKDLLTVLWGALTQQNAIKMRIRFDEEFEVREGNEVVSMTTISDEKYEVEMVNKNKRYETNFARIKPFLLAKGRVKIAQHIEPYMDHVYRCHTDSMTSDIMLPIKTSKKLGDMKYEGQCPDCKIVNSMTVIGEFY